MAPAANACERFCRALGIQNLTLVSEQAEPDGHFPTCPYPNPEIREAMAARTRATASVCAPIFSSAPTPTATAAAWPCQDGKGSYRLLTGNEVGVLLLDFICQHAAI